MVFIFFFFAIQHTDKKMQKVMELAHEFLQNFCWGNPSNQSLLHKHIDLFLTPGVSGLTICHVFTLQTVLQAWESQCFCRISYIFVAKCACFYSFSSPFQNSLNNSLLFFVQPFLMPDFVQNSLFMLRVYILGYSIEIYTPSVQHLGNIYHRGCRVFT